jgi:hypothetical protein
MQRRSIACSQEPPCLADGGRRLTARGRAVSDLVDDGMDGGGDRGVAAQIQFEGKI